LREQPFRRGAPALADGELAMTYRLIVALVTALAIVGVSAAGSPPAVMERPVPAAPNCPEPAAEGWGPVWFTADYLLGYVYGVRVAPLVTTNPPDTPRSVAGIFGNPTTVSLFHGRVNADERSGVRARAGLWFDEGKRLGLEVGYSMLESQSTLFSGYNNGNAILARPYTNAINVQANVGIVTANEQRQQFDQPLIPFLQTQEAVLVTFPNSASGGIDIRVTSGNFYEGHVNLTDNFFDDGTWRLDALAGYRMYRYDEGLRIRQISVATNNPNLTPGTQVFVGDDFSTQNEFHGVDLGLRTSYRWESLTLEVLTKVAVGNLRRRVDIYGGQQITVPGGTPELRVGGVYALASNIGQYNFNDFQALPELGFTVGYQVNDYLRLRTGYNILFLENVSRAADQIDTTLNPDLFPGSGQPAPTTPQLTRPVPTNVKDSVWIMSVNFGVELVY
jgi:hypothetical protein